MMTQLQEVGVFTPS